MTIAYWGQSMKKLLIVVLFFLVCSTLFAKREMEISFWHSLGFHVKEIIEEMADEYNSEHRGIKVNPVFQGLYEDMQVKMVAAAVTRQLPDVAQVQFEYLDSYVDNNLIDPIDDEIPPEARSDILDIMWQLVTRNGNIYGVPFCVSTTVMFYNEDAFIKAGLNPDHAPDTWEEMIRMGKKLTKDTDGDGVYDQYAMMFWTNGFYGIAPFLWDNGGSLFSKDGKSVELTSPQMIATINMLRDLIFKYKIMPQTWTDWEGGQAFLTGKLAFGFFTSAAISYGEQNLPWKLKIAPMPKVNGHRYTMLAGSGLVNFTKNRKKRRAVNDFIFWLVNKENTLRIHESVGYIPVRKSALDSLSLKAFLKDNPNFKVPIDSLAFAKPLPTHPEYFKINKKITDMLEQITLNKADPLETLKKTEQEINREIQ